MTRKDLLEYAELHYPPGTVVSNRNLDLNHVHSETMVVEEEPRYHYDGANVYAHALEIGGRELSLRRTLYKNGVWAEIINAPEPNYQIY